MKDNQGEMGTRYGGWRYILAAIVIALCLVGVSIAVGYAIGRAVKGKELDEKSSSKSAKVTAEKNAVLYKEAVQKVSRSRLRENLRYFTSVPHSGGSKESYDLAIYMKNKWIEYGFDKVELKKYQILLSFPEKPGVVTVHYGNGTEAYRTLPVDASMDIAYNDSRVFPPFTAYSPARSVKHGRAHKAGAIGLIMYMDPQNFAKQGVDKVYPEYNWLPKNAVQRGTIKYSPVRGDPLTPGYPAVDGIYRLPMEEAKKDLPQIPVQPMSYQDAEPLLRMLKGSVNNPSWQGGLPFTYGVEMDEHDTRVVTVNVSTVLKQKDVYNVIGTIRGSVEPDSLVLLGNHRDAWVYGAADASSGTAALMETSRVIGNLVQKGWRPRRSLIFCSWGAEEPQTMGSAEWMEDYARLLHRRAVAYLNVDMSVDGAYSFRAKSMPLMDWALFDVTKKVPSPYGNESVFDEWRRKLPDKTERYERKKEVPSVQSIRSGSDYVMFYQRLGIPCVDIRYTYDRKTSGNPLYHTIYDNFVMMSTLTDPEFKFHQVTTRAWVQLAFHMSDSIIVPFNVTHYASMMKYYSGRMKLDYGKTLALHDVTLEHVNSAIENFTRAAEEFQERIDATDLNNENAVSRINERLIVLERSFIDESAIIPDKPLQRHVILTPSFHVYGSWFGGVVEAMYRVDDRGESWEIVKKQISVVLYAIRSATHILSMSPI
ncbi:hypothetical protein QZH41_011181 [Actinostola sp. cb2023]|nr:hypothetical protein QZH41_011181 [Actinostola sp. cb2023]